MNTTLAHTASHFGALCFLSCFATVCPLLDSKPNDARISELIVGFGGIILIDQASGDVVGADFSRSALRDSELEQIALIGKKIKILRLDNCVVSEKGLGALKSMPGLTVLSISGSIITNEAAKHIASLPKLEQLCLNACNLECTSLKSLARLEQLKMLDLHHTNVADVGIAELLPLRQPTGGS